MLTIHENRMNEVKRLHAIKGSNNENALSNYNANYWSALEIDLEECKKEKTIMTQFYRLCALSVRSCEFDNSQAFASGKSWAINYHKELEQKEAKAIERVKKALEPYGLTISYCGICPTICVKHEGGGISEVIRRFFY